MVLVLIFLVVGIVTAIFFIWNPLFSTSKAAPQLKSGWWGRGSEANYKEDTSIRKFTISVPNEVLTDLKSRLQMTIYPEPLENANFEYGFSSTYLKEIVDYWLNDYNWTVHEAKLNSFEHFKTQIEGLDIHFMHIRPVEVPSHVRVIPILLIHGWPGSIVEFLDIVPLLTSTRQGQDFVFEVICPSIPGYGFSEASHQKGFGLIYAAQIFDKLMQRLGFQSYYVQGGDWGAIISQGMAVLYPNRIKGLHVNMVVRPASLVHYFKLFVGQYMPWLFGIDSDDYQNMYPIKDKFVRWLRESGYMHIQSTKPDTVGLGLANSPAGLAAYILEKFSSWTDMTGIQDPKGKLTEKFSLDQLLTNVMVYWVTGSITSSQRFYKEYFSNNKLHNQLLQTKAKVPTAVAAFPNEIVGRVAKSQAKEAFGDVLVSYKKMLRGGHFAAMEEPQLLADDVWDFVATVEKLPH